MCNTCSSNNFPEMEKNIFPEFSLGQSMFLDHSLKVEKSMLSPARESELISCGL
jgi:hypothetical protein